MISHKAIIIWISGPEVSRNSDLAKAVLSGLINLGASAQLLLPDGEELSDIIPPDSLDTPRQAKIIYKIANLISGNSTICITAGRLPLSSVPPDYISHYKTVEVVNDINKIPSSSVFTIHASNNHDCNSSAAADEIIDALISNGIIDNIASFKDSIYSPQNKYERPGFPQASMVYWKNKGKFSKQGFKVFVEDCMLHFGLKKYNYKRNIIFIAGLPKSGTNWLQRMIELIPGYHYRPVYSPTRKTFFHDISPLIFEQLPSYAYSVVRLHTRYTPYNFHVIKNYVDKFVVLYRDPRDTVVSRYHHVMKDKTHRHHNMYNSFSQEEGIFHSIIMIFKDYIEWINDWEEAANENSTTIIKVRYEEMNSNPVDTMKRVYEFFELPYNSHTLESVLKSKIKKPQNLDKSLEERDTKRKGIVGDWKNYFTDEHKALFKSSPAGDLLLRLGYEKDNNW